MGLSVQEKKRKIDFQDGGHGGHLGLPISMILIFFDLQVTLMLSTKFRVNWLLGLGEEAKNRWQPSWISDWQDFMFFDLQVTPMLPTMFGVNWPFGSGVKVQNRFSRWSPWPQFGISYRNDLSYFLSTSHPDASYQVLSLLAFQFGRRREK